MERQARVGRKLQATGNGRCNLSNLHGTSGGYHGENPGFADYALGKLPPTAALEWFRGLGLLTVAEDSGRLYPYSDQANSVVDVLRFALEKPNITVKLGFEAKKVKKTASGFRIVSGDETVECDRLIVACGGLAGTKLGGQHVRLSNSAELRPQLHPAPSGAGAAEKQLERGCESERRPRKLPCGHPPRRKTVFRKHGGAAIYPVRPQRAGDF